MFFSPAGFEFDCGGRICVDGVPLASSARRVTISSQNVESRNAVVSYQRLRRRVAVGFLPAIEVLVLSAKWGNEGHDALGTGGGPVARGGSRRGPGGARRADARRLSGAAPARRATPTPTFPWTDAAHGPPG